ncbi:DUF4331 domain-containing protein [Methylosoma difficile]
MKLNHPLSALTMAMALSLSTPLFAADHAEAPLVESDAASDIADVYAFLDPNDNSKAILAFDVHGFIVPGENGNLGGFDPSVRYQFNIENTGDANPDKLITIIFNEQTSRSNPQSARVRILGKDGTDKIFNAPTTVSSATAEKAPTPSLKKDAATGITFFAGLVDDPFFFDIPGFNRFVSTVLSGSPDVSQLNRGRDTFAGYNSQMIVLSVPVSLLKGSAGDVIGVSATTLRNAQTIRSKTDDPINSGVSYPIDRMGVPTINTVLIPFPRKNEYNRASTADDAAGKFAGDIVSTLTALGTDAAHIGILADVAVTKGDMLRLNTAVANTGKQGGNNAGAGFPNGRRPVDDVIDTVLFLVTNEGLTTGDNVNANDKVFRNSFPFFAASHQPLPTGTLDDNTRN